MRARLLMLLLAVAVIAPSCVLADLDTEESTSLDDPATLEQLGIPEPEIAWQRSGDGIEIVGTEGRAVPPELELLFAALGEIPNAVRDEIIVRYIVRTPQLDAVDLHPATTAFARGPDIYLINRTFQEERAGASRLEMARVLLHEMAHVAQFQTLDSEYVAGILDGSITTTDTSLGSTLVHDFAEFVGWVDTGSAPFEPEWSLPASAAGTTEYGRSAPDEDMAEALAMVAMGRAALVSQDRVAWVEDWLGVSSVDLAVGKPWMPPGSVQAYFREPVYDEAAVQTLRPAHAEPQYWVLTSDMPPADQLADRVGLQLRDRGLVGTLESVDDPRLPRFSGRFLRNDGVSFWVELWDFRESTGFRSAPDGPVLTYVMEW